MQADHYGGHWSVIMRTSVSGQSVVSLLRGISKYSLPTISHSHITPSPLLSILYFSPPSALEPGSWLWLCCCSSSPASLFWLLPAGWRVVVISLSSCHVNINQQPPSPSPPPPPPPSQPTCPPSPGQRPPRFSHGRVLRPAGEHHVQRHQAGQ